CVLCSVDHRDLLSFPTRRSSDLGWVQYQPKGTVGIMGTWNAPLFTLLSPLACAFAAGNRAVLKPSEIVPRTAALLAELIDRQFDPLELAIITGGVEVGQAFASQPFNHLVFT